MILFGLIYVLLYFAGSALFATLLRARRAEDEVRMWRRRAEEAMVREFRAKIENDRLRAKLERRAQFLPPRL